MTVCMISSSVHLSFVIQHGGKIKPKIGPKVIHILLALEKLFVLLKFVVFIKTCFPIKSNRIMTLLECSLTCLISKDLLSAGPKELF